MYGEKCKRLMTEIKEDLKKKPCSLTRRVNTGKMSTSPKLLYRFNAISIKIPAGVFGYKLIVRFI